MENKVDNEQKRKTSKKRTREFSFIVYMTESELGNAIASMQIWHNLRHYAFIKHDKDIDENGKQVEPHYHLYLYFVNARELKGTWYLLKSYTKSNVMIEECYDRYTLINEYFTHKMCPNKHQYGKNEIFTSDEGFFKGTVEENKTVDLLMDIINGTDLLTMAKKYGRDYIINRERYENYAQEMAKGLKIETELRIGGDK